MAITDSLVLPADMLVVPVDELSQEVRRQFEADAGDYALTRPHSRTPSRIVDAETAELLKEFRKPATVAEAIIRFSRARSVDPAQTLEDAFPMIERFVLARLLVEADSDHAHKIQPLLAIAERFAETEVTGCVQVLEDTDLYRVKTASGEPAALKLMRPGASPDVGKMFDRETFILERLEGGTSPRLLKTGAEDHRRYLLMEWCPGEDCATAAAGLRNLGARDLLLQLCGSILDAYAQLHARNVIHSDIHPRNVLVNEKQAPRLIDFGLARVSGVDTEFRHARRGGVGFFFEPEYAKAVRAGHRPPPSTAVGEQYALAALLYSLVSGKQYLNFSLEKDEMFRQIADDGPLSFAAQGWDAWPELEEVLARALAKTPAERYSSVAEFAEQWKTIPAPRLAVPQSGLAETSPALFDEAESMLDTMLARLSTDRPLFASGLKTAPKTSITYGSAGIAYGLYRIASVRENAALLSLADLWATRAERDVAEADAFYNDQIEITEQVVGRISPYHTESGVHAVRALIGSAMGDIVAQQAAVRKFIAAATAAECSNLDMTLGRSGVLLTASLLFDAVSASPLVDVSELVRFGNDFAKQIWTEIEQFPPIRECREIRYSGAAHGWSGILYAMLCWCRSSGNAFPAGIEDRLVQLAGLAQYAGRCARWNWTIGRASRSEAGGFMSGWCNGSAGFVYLWSLAHQTLKDERFLVLEEKSAWDAWETDSQLGNLCCGFAGQAYALLRFYKDTGEKAWLHRAQAQAEKAAQAFRQMPSGPGYQALADRPESLYKGELGVAVLAAELRNPEDAAMPFFESH